MNKRIVYSQPDGVVAVIIPALADRRLVAETERRPRRLETDEEFLARVSARDLPAGAVDVMVCELSEIPADRTFRDAWKHGATAPVEVDMLAARNIHWARIRAARDRELARLDIEQLKGSDVAAQKQELRDIPQVFDLTVAATPEELSALWPMHLSRDS